MTKEKLIEELSKLPNGVEVCIFDHKLNLHEDSGEGSSVGIYKDFDVSLMDVQDITDKSIPFAVMAFDSHIDYSKEEDCNNPRTLTEQIERMIPPKK